MCVCVHVFLKDKHVCICVYTHTCVHTHIHTHTLVCTESLSLELMYKKLVATKCYQGGELGVKRGEGSLFTECIPFSSP